MVGTSNLGSWDGQWFDIYPWNAPIVDHVWIAVMSNACVMLPCVCQKKSIDVVFQPLDRQLCLFPKIFWSQRFWPDMFSTPRLVGFFWLYYVILVGGLEHFYTFFMFPYIRNYHPNWRTHIFQRGRYTTNQNMITQHYTILLVDDHWNNAYNMV